MAMLTWRLHCRKRSERIGREAMSMQALNRRRFLKSTLVTAATVTLAQLKGRALGERAGPVLARGIPSWVDKPVRWGQLTLVEDDPSKFDPSFWFDYFRRTRCDAVCLSGGGCVAYYPTQIPFHHRSRWLGDRDVLGEL